MLQRPSTKLATPLAALAGAGLTLGAVSLYALEAGLTPSAALFAGPAMAAAGLGLGVHGVRALRRARKLALRDHETELPNRRAHGKAVQALVERSDVRAAVLAIGIDRFEYLLNAIGYGQMSEMMGRLGERLAGLRPNLAPARLVTGALAATFPVRDAEEAQAVARVLQKALEGPIAVGGATLDVGLTLGLAIEGEHGHDAAALVQNASVALDQARAARKKLALFDQRAYGDPRSNLSLMSEMLKGLKDGSLSLHYQPKLDLRQGAVCGIEALSRWRHPGRGDIAPDLFVAMAEETGHIRALTDWSLDRALRDQAQLRARGVDLRISVNLSGRLVADADFARKALARIKASNGKIAFEITETAVIESVHTALEILAEYHANDVPVAIDDYGSGLSSLAYLKQITARELKIDKAFILTLDSSRRDALLVKSTIDLAHGLGMIVTAEGVETPETLAMLSVLGCDLGQGFHIARPMPLNELFGFLDARPGRVDRLAS